MGKELNATSPLTVREKLAIKILILILKLLKPFEWSHELDKALVPIEKLIDEGK